MNQQKQDMGDKEIDSLNMKTKDRGKETMMTIIYTGRRYGPSKSMVCSGRKILVYKSLEFCCLSSARAKGFSSVCQSHLAEQTKTMGRYWPVLGWFDHRSSSFSFSPLVVTVIRIWPQEYWTMLVEFETNDIKLMA